MSYSTQSGTTPGDIMPARISEQDLLQLTSENETVVQSVIDDAIEAADAEINSYCAVRYAVPFSSVPLRIKNLSADMAVYYLFKKRAATVGMPDPIRESYEDAIAYLKDVSKGIASLGIDPAPTAQSSSNVRFNSNERQFTKSTLNNF